MLPEQHHKLQPCTQHPVQAGGQESPEFALKCQKDSRSQTWGTTTHKAIDRDAAGPAGMQEQEFLLLHPKLKALSLSFMAGIKDSQIKPFLPCAVRCLDVLGTLLQSAQSAVLPLNCCFSRESCSAGKCLGWQTLRRSSSTSLSGRGTASASRFPRPPWVLFPIHQDGFLPILVRHPGATLCKWRLY